MTSDEHLESLDMKCMCPPGHSGVCLQCKVSALFTRVTADAVKAEREQNAREFQHRLLFGLIVRPTSMGNFEIFVEDMDGKFAFIGTISCHEWHSRQNRLERSKKGANTIAGNG